MFKKTKISSAILAAAGTLVAGQAIAEANSIDEVVVTGLDKATQRKALKLLVLTAINAASKETAYKAYQSKRTASKDDINSPFLSPMTLTSGNLTSEFILCFRTFCFVNLLM